MIKFITYITCNENFRSEQDFKNWYMQRLCKARGPEMPVPKAVFEVENEEKEPGFPDVLVVNHLDEALFFEIKVAKKGGRFTMEKTQPRFYASHPDLHIRVIVFDAEEHKVYSIPKEVVLEEVKRTSNFTLNVRRLEVMS